VFRAQGLLQALRVGGGLAGQAELWRRRPRGRGGVLGPEAMALQGLRGEVMRREHPLNAAVIDRVAITRPDHPCQRARRKGRRDRQPHDLWLDGAGQEGLCGGLAPRMGQGAPIDQAQEARPPKAPQVPPQPPVVQPGPWALLDEGPLTRQPGTNGLIAGSDVLGHRRFTDEQGEL
jgi:hypothetical protein